MNSTAAQKPPITVSVASLRQLWDESLAWLASHFLQIVIAGAVGAALVAAMLGLRILGNRLCRRHTSLTHWPQTIGRVISQTTLWFMVLLAAKLVQSYANPPGLVVQTVNVLFTIAAALQGAIWVRELVISIVEHRAGDHAHGTLGSAMGIIRLLVTVVLYAIAIVLILDNLGVNVTGLIAGLGIGGIAIGLAAKGIFDDLFSALSIIFDRPFRQGDSIRWDQTSGTVEAIGLKTTRVRAVTGEEVVISNTNLLNKELHNMARLARRRIVMTIGIGYYTPPELCARVPDILREIVEGQDKCSLVRCGLFNFGMSSLDYELQYDVRSEVYDEVFAARNAVNLAMVERFAREGIDFAFPTQVDVHGDATGRPIADAPVRPEPEADAPAQSAPGTPETRRELAPDWSEQAPAAAGSTASNKGE